MVHGSFAEALDLQHTPTVEQREPLRVARIAREPVPDAELTGD
jgi:hypothetical protein